MSAARKLSVRLATHHQTERLTKAQEPYFDVRKVLGETDAEPLLEISAGTLDHTPNGQSRGTGDVPVFVPMRAGREPTVKGRMVFPERATMEFEGSLEMMRALWMERGTKCAFLSDQRFSFLRL